MPLGESRFNTYVMVPHVHSKDFAQGDNVVNPGPPMDAAFKASSSFPLAGQFGIVLTGQGGFPEAFLFRPSGGSGGTLMAAQTGGGGMGELFTLANNTPSVLTRGVAADVVQARTANGTLTILFVGTGDIAIGDPNGSIGSLVFRGTGISGWSLMLGQRTADRHFGLISTNQFGLVQPAWAMRLALSGVFGFDANQFVFEGLPVAIYPTMGAVTNRRILAGLTAFSLGTQGDGETFDSVPHCFDLPIANGALINPGETTKWDPANPGRVITGGGGALQPVGVCVVGGLGDVAGSVKATIFYMGYKAILVSGGAITQFRRIKPGAVAGQWVDGGAAAIAALQHSPAVALQAVGASGLNFKAFFDGTRLYV